MAFRVKEYLPGVYQIEDVLGVCMTLLTGSERALLVDTGYGLEDVSAFVRTLTELPLMVLLTHGHHDHALGARWFDEVLMHPDDLPAFSLYTGDTQRRAVLASAAAKGIPVSEKEYLNARMPSPLPLIPGEIDLGGLRVAVMHCPGHTPGSCTVYVPERSLMLTGDDWNPCTWVFFQESLPVGAYRRTLRGILESPFEHVLCSHRFDMRERMMIRDFANGLTDAALRDAVPVDTGAARGIRTAEARLPHDQVLVFDADKYEKERDGLL